MTVPNKAQTQEKPGVKTTEFYVSAVVIFTGLMVTFGVLSPEIAANLNNAFAQAAVAIFGLGTALITAVNYARGRTDLKLWHLQHHLPAQPEQK